MRSMQLVPPAEVGRVAYDQNNDLLAHFHRLGQRRPDAGLVQHLLSHVEAALTTQERLLLYSTLVQSWKQLTGSEQDACCTWLSGRYRSFLHLCEEPWGTPEQVCALAWAHLRAGSGLSQDAQFVTLLYESLGIRVATLLNHGWPAKCAWPYLVACVQAHEIGAIGPDLGELVQVACIGLVEGDDALRGDGLLLMLELALRMGDMQMGTEILAVCIQHGLHRRISRQTLLCWITGGDGSDWALQPQYAARWLRPESLGDMGYVTDLACALQASPFFGRIESLAQQLGVELDPDANRFSGRPSSDVWYVVRALAVLEGRPADELVEVALEVLDAQAAMLTDACWGAIQRHRASLAWRQGRMAQAWISACAARSRCGDVASEALLTELMSHWRADVVIQGLELRAQAWESEASLWRELGHGPQDELAQAALYALAVLCSDGALYPQRVQRRQDLPAAHALWTYLSTLPQWTHAAQERLSSWPFKALLPIRQDVGGREHLWLERPGANRVLVVFSCVESHHTFASVPTLLAEMTDHHLLFIHNPELNWFSGQVFGQVQQVLSHHVGSRFRPDQVSCYFGSMGGYGALRFALANGWRAIVFNPQVDLDLWSAYRPLQRQLIQAELERVNLQDLPVDAYANSPLYLMVGDSTPDRLACGVLLRRMQAASHGSWILEKFSDPHHAGLISRASRGKVTDTVKAADRRLGELTDINDLASLDAQWRVLAPEVVDGFWCDLLACEAIKVEILTRSGITAYRTSEACETR